MRVSAEPWVVQTARYMADHCTDPIVRAHARVTIAEYEKLQEQVHQERLRAIVDTDDEEDSHD